MEARVKAMEVEEWVGRATKRSNPRKEFDKEDAEGPFFMFRGNTRYRGRGRGESDR